MSARPQLKLVTEAVQQNSAPMDPTRRVFDHWVAMNGRMVARCKLGPTRRQAINAWLTVYDEDQLLAAIEGMAADPLEGCNPGQRAAMRELEWLLASESRIERWSELGFTLRDELAAADRRCAAPVVADEPVVDPAEAAAARARLVALARRRRGEG